MADYAPFQLYIYSCPAGSEERVLEVINEHRLSLDWDWGIEGERALVSREIYGRSDVMLDEPTGIISELIAAVPDIAFKAWQDPKGEWPGEAYTYAPKLGLRTFRCDSGGNATISFDDVRRQLAQLPDDAMKAAVLYSLAELFGERYRLALEGEVASDEAPTLE